jgi:hypothetical protein
MRTTVNIQGELLQHAKQLALQQHETLGGVIEDALRKLFSKNAATAQIKPTRLSTFKGKGLQPGVDLDDTADLLDIMENR